MGENNMPPDKSAEAMPSTSTSPACLSGSAEIDLTALVRENAERLYGYAYRLCGQAATAEDLVQQTFMAAHANLHQLRESEKAVAWLFAILRRVYWKSRRKKRPLMAVDLEIDPDQQAEPAEANEIDHEFLQQALDDLPDPFRVVLVMFYFEDCSYQEIAEGLELPLGTVMSRLARAKKHLRNRLQSSDAVRGH